MGFFSSKTELNNKIAQLETENKYLLEGKQICEQANVELREENKKLSAELVKYHKDFVDTGLECETCYSVLHRSFKYCPNCGKPIIYKEKYENNDKVQYENQFSIENDKNDCIITHYDISGQKTVVIPSMLYGRPVIGLGYRAFFRCQEIEEIIFEEGCQYIGNEVFWGCKQLKKIHLPKSLIEIGEEAFRLCESLEEIVLPANVEVIGKGAFGQCIKLKNVVFSEKIKCISDSAFCKTALKEVRFPANLGVIERFAFACTPLKEVYLPEDLQIVEYGAFGACKNLKKIVVHSNVEIFSKDALVDSPAIVYCSEGSVGHLAARKKRRDTVFIQAVPKTKKKITYVKSIFIDHGNLRIHGNYDTYKTEWFLERIGEQKADKWSWYKPEYDRAVTSATTGIWKCFTYEDAMELKTTLMKYGVRVVFDMYDQQKEDEDHFKFYTRF